MQLRGLDVCTRPAEKPVLAIVHFQQAGPCSTFAFRSACSWVKAVKPFVEARTFRCKNKFARSGCSLHSRVHASFYPDLADKLLQWNNIADVPIIIRLPGIRTRRGGTSVSQVYPIQCSLALAAVHLLSSMDCLADMARALLRDERLAVVRCAL